jgi:hypothetical protein
MPEQLDQPALCVSANGTLDDRLRNTPGLRSLIAEAEATWHARARSAEIPHDEATPTWRAFEDSFPTFYEFTNRPR